MTQAPENRNLAPNVCPLLAALGGRLLADELDSHVCASCHMAKVFQRFPAPKPVVLADLGGSDGMSWSGWVGWAKPLKIRM